MINKGWIACIIVLGMLVACSACAGRRTIDMLKFNFELPTGITQSQYEMDLDECREQVDSAPTVVTEIVLGSAITGLIMKKEVVKCMEKKGYKHIKTPFLKKKYLHD